LKEFIEKLSNLLLFGSDGSSVVNPIIHLEISFIVGQKKH